MGWLRRPVPLPAALLAGLLLLLAASFVQGLRAARDRQAMLLPARGVEVPLRPTDPASVDVDLAVGALVVRLPADLGRARVGLYQILPARTLARWIQTEPANGSTLVIPTAGLADGRYAVTRHEGQDAATTRDMDRPPERLDILGEFELRRR